ncbi:MAG TPA: hypothetical protein VD963_04880, partial [Phycisphaerales bacterium]|nr:hypothetical protein [Phycisphaerales bacterium]
MFRLSACLPAAALVLVLAAPARAQRAGDAVAVLTDSAKAISEVKSASFKARKYTEGMLKGLMDVSGEGKFIRTVPDRMKSPQWYTGRSKISLGGSKEETFTVALDQSGTVTWVDEANKKVLKSPLQVRSEAYSQLGSGQQLLIDEFLAPKPFDQPLTQSESLKLEAPADVAGEPCDVVRVIYPGGSREILWSISKRDRLPRRVEMIGNEKGNQPVVMVNELSELKTEPVLGPEQLAVA